MTSSFLKSFFLTYGRFRVFKEDVIKMKKNMNIKTLLLIGISVLLTLTNVQAADKKAEHLPLDAFAMLPAISDASVSKDGKQLAYLRAINKEGNYIVEIRQTDDLSKKPIRLGADHMEITGFSWLNNKKIAVFFRQKIKDGGKNYWTSKLAIINADGKGSWLELFKKDRRASFSLMDLLPNNDDEILIEYDVNRNQYPDVVRFNINNGRTRTILRGNKKRSSGFVADHDGEVRAVGGYNQSENSLDLYARVKGDSDWKLVYQNFAKERDNFDFLGFAHNSDNEIYVNANRGEDKTGIYLYNIETGKYSERLFGIGKVNADGIITSRKKANRGELLGYRYTTKHPMRYYTNEKEAGFYNGIKAMFKGKFVSIRSRSEDDNTVVIQTISGKDPGTYYLLKNKNKLEKIGEKFPLLKPEHLAKVKYISYKARDGRKIPAYVTIPNGKKPYPTVVMPHGGPWVRDVTIYDEWAQLLAHHGYLVIQPQYRGSTGFGLDHWKAGDKKWGLSMQDDLDDGAQFLVKKGLADENRLIMFGWSYGGYAAFAGSMRDNNIYQCTVAGAGVSNLNRVNSTISHPFGRASQRPTIAGVSPIEHVEKVNVPILIVHGDMDKIVPIIHSQNFVEKLEAANKDFKYVELKSLGHKSNMFSYQHKSKFYSELLNWLESKCGS
jgi:dipeptidyl aminopeptidase/acylaminoacyl peptidase